jgi:hypothetical protein
MCGGARRRESEQIRGAITMIEREVVGKVELCCKVPEEQQ